MTASHQRSFRRSGALVGTLGRTVVRFEPGPHPAAAFEALEQPCIIASNHRSVFDALAGMHAIGRTGLTARTLSASWLWDNKPLGRLLDSVGAIPLPPGRGAMEAIDLAVETLRNGEHLLLTPEGRVVPPDERVDGVGDGRKIVSKIARAAGVSVVPVALVGTDQLWPLGETKPVVRPWDRPRIAYGWGPPIACDAENHRVNADAVMVGIADVVRTLESARRPVPTARV